MGTEIYFSEASDFAKRGLYYIPRVGRCVYDSRHTANGRNIPTCMLILVDEGCLHIAAEGQKQTAFAGKAVLFNCMNTYQYYSEGLFRARWLHITGSNSADYVQEIVAKRGICWDVKRSGACEECVETVINMVESGSVNDHVLSYTVHRLLAEALMHSDHDTSATEAALERSVIFMLEHWNEPITLNDLAASATFSQYYYSKQFKLYKGTSPYEYLIRIRMNHAKQLLYMTDDSIDAISRACGFESTSYFIRQFRKREKMTPKQFRENGFHRM